MSFQYKKKNLQKKPLTNGPQGPIDFKLCRDSGCENSKMPRFLQTLVYGILQMLISNLHHKTLNFENLEANLAILVLRDQDVLESKPLTPLIDLTRFDPTIPICHP